MTAAGAGAMTNEERHELLTVIDGIFLRCGLLKGSKADLAMERELAAELEKMWNGWCDTQVADMMAGIPEELTEDAVRYIRDMLADALGPDFAGSEKVKGLMEGYIRKAYLGGKKGIKAVVPQTKAELGKMNVFDRNAVRVLSKHNCYWLGEHYGKEIGPKIAEITEAAVRDGIGRKELAASLKAALGDSAEAGYKYWDVVSSAALVRSRSFGCVSGMAEAEISEYEILAMGDERMCKICGNMHGRVFSVSAAMDKINSVLSIEDPEAFKNAMPWGGFDPKSSNSTLMTQGRAIPPFHGRCRCTMVVTNKKVRHKELPDNLRTIQEIIDDAIQQQNLEAIPNFKDVAAAEQFAYDNLLGDSDYRWAEFDGLDLETSKEYIRSVMRNQALFPELRKNFDGLGTCQAALQHEGRRAVVSKRVAAFSNPPIEYYEKKVARGIFINAHVGGDSKLFKERSLKSVEVKFNPEGTGTILATIDHEMAHQIDDLLVLSDRRVFYDKKIAEIYANLVGKKRGKEKLETIKEALCEYAASSPQEFIAEAWSEYLNNPSPRPVAKAVGDRIMELRKERYQK